MPLTIPNSADAAFGAQSEPDSRDFDAIVAAMGGTCVLAGCAVTAQGVPNMTVAVAAGTIASSTTVASVTGGNVTIAANASGNPRFDLIVSTSAGAAVVRQGTAAVNPTFPTLTAGDVMLAAVWVPNGVAAINANQIIDKRALTDYPTANPVALAAAANSGSALTISLSDHVHPTTGLGVLASANTWTNTNVFSSTVTAQTGLTVGTNAGSNVVLGVTGAAAQQKDINFQTAGVRRWLFRSDGTAESGSNAGSDFEFYSFDDAGATLWAVWSVVRATGLTTYSKPVRFTADAIVGNDPVIWTHSNTNYRGSLGVYSGAGHPFLGLHAEHSTTANTLQNDGSGSRGAVIATGQVSSDAVSIQMGDTAAANTAWTTPVTLATFFYNAGIPLLQVNPGLAVGVSVAGAATGSPARVVAIGTDTNIILGLNAKGTGSTDLNVAASTGTGGTRFGDGAGALKAQIDSAGRAGFGGSSGTQIMVQLSGTHPYGSAGATYGFFGAFIAPSTSTFQSQYYGRVNTAVAAFALPNAPVFYASNPSLGAGSSVGTTSAFYAENQGLGGSITNAYGLYVNFQSGATTLNVGAMLGGGTQANLWLNSSTASAAGGISFGTPNPTIGDTVLYRAGTSSLKTDGTFGVYQTSTIGGVVIQNSTSGPWHLVMTRSDYASTQVSLWNGPSVGVGTFIVANNAGATMMAVDQQGRMGLAGLPSALSFIDIAGAHPNGTATSYGMYVHPTFPTASTTEINGLRVQMTTPSAVYTVATAVALRVASTSLGVNSIITDNYGIWVEPRTVGTNDYGVRIDSAQTQTLWLSADQATPTTAAMGIAIGTNRDVVLYRVGTTRLRLANIGNTAGIFDVATSIFVGTNPAAGGTINVPNNAALAARNAANSADINLIYADASNWVNVGGTTLRVDASGFRVGIGVNPQADSLLNMEGAVHPSASLSIWGTLFDFSAPATATTLVQQIYGLARQANSAYTITTYDVVYIEAPAQPHASNVITTLHGIRVRNQGAATKVGTAFGLRISAQSGSATSVAVRLEGGDTANLHLASDVASAAGGINFGATVAANQSMYRQASGVIEAGGTFSAVTGFQVNHATATAGHYLRGDGTRFVDNTIQAADLPGSFSGFATPAIVLGTAAAAGAATTGIRSDSTIAAFDATVPAALGSAATGSIAFAARRDHVHPTTNLALLNAANTFSSGIQTVVNLTAGGSKQSAALVSARNTGNSYEFGHTNPAGYASTIGATSSSGNPFIAFHAETDAGNTFQTRGLLGRVIMNSVGTSVFSIGRLTTTTGTLLTPTADLSIDSAGAVSLISTLSIAGASATITNAASNNPYYMLSDGTSIMKMQMIGTTYGWTGTQSNHPYVLGTNNVENVRILTSGKMQGGYGFTNNPAYASGTIQEHFLGYANNSPTNWAMSLAYLGDASYVNHVVTINARLTGGTRSAPTFTSGGGTGGVVLMHDPSAGMFYMGTVSGAGVAMKSSLTIEPVNGYVGIGIAASSSYSLLLSTVVNTGKGLVIRAVTSQSAVLAEWQGPAGSPVYGEIDSVGVMRQYGPTAGTTEYAARVTADTVDRLVITADGTHNWGPGNAATDTTLARVAVGVLQLNGEFNILGQSSTTSLLVLKPSGSLSADYQQLQDSSANVLSRVDGDGYAMFKNLDEKMEWAFYAPVTGAATFKLSNDNNTTLTTTGTLTSGAVNNMPTILCTTGATSGNTSGIITNAVWVTGNYEPEFHARVLLDSTITNIRIWIGLVANDMSGVGVVTTQTCLAFRYDTGVPDTKWQCISSDGTSGSGTDSGVTPVASTVYNFAIVRNTQAANEWRFYINGNLVATKSVNMPATTAQLRPQICVTTLTAAARAIFVGFCKVRIN